MKKKVLISILIFIIFSVLSITSTYANEITDGVTILLNNSKINSKVTDKKESTFIAVSKNDVINISSNKIISGLYIVYEVESKTGTLEANGQTLRIGENGFIHEYINISETIKDVKELTIKYDSDLKISDIYVLDEGPLPDFVEIWEKPYEKADLMLLSSHADDEQLFFLGLLPTYVARGANVQVVYFTYHGDQTIRYHEQLHGLYTVGVRHYPIIGIIPDAYSTTLDGAIKNMKKAGISEDDALKFQVEMIRRFKPQVVVGHDEKGEYSHGQHILNTYLLEKAILLANDETYDTDSLSKYGRWDVLKLYLHLYDKNQIILDYDTPLDYFGGKTAYEVSKEGYKKHNTQQWTWFTKWINGANNSYKKATDIKKYSPTQYGLYYKSIEQEDINKNDFLENITLYGEQERIAKAELEKVEKEKKEQQIQLAENKNSTNGNLIYVPIIFIGVVFIVICTRRVIINKNKKAQKIKKTYKKKKEYNYKMKKNRIFVLIAIILICTFVIVFIVNKPKQEPISSENTIKNEINNEEPKEDAYVDTNPIKLGLYLLENGKRILQTTYTNTWQYHKDINSFNIFYTQEEEIDNSAIRIVYGKYLEKYDEAITSKYRNGFHLHFTTTEGVVDKTILSPKDTEGFYDFLEIYLYDSYHRKAGEWYSHTTEEEFNEKTTLTSIKLTAGKRVNDITSDIEVTAFSYDDDDFDENGNYKGISKYSMTVKRK